MTFPAELSFKRDTRLTSKAIRVYLYLSTEIGPDEPSPVLISRHSPIARVDRESFGQALNELVRFGYLVEHPRSGRTRRFALAREVSVA